MPLRVLAVLGDEMDLIITIAALWTMLFSGLFLYYLAEMFRGLR